MDINALIQTIDIAALPVIFAITLHEAAHGYAARHFGDPKKLIQLFDRYATYNGSSPYLTPGIMSMIPHLEQHYCAFIPEGGMISITNALYQLAVELRVKFNFNAKVNRIVVQNKVVAGVEVDKFYPADVVVSNRILFQPTEHY